MTDICKSNVAEFMRRARNATKERRGAVCPQLLPESIVDHGFMSALLPLVVFEEMFKHVPKDTDAISHTECADEINVVAISMLLHDLHEVYAKDVPYPIKNDSNATKEAYALLEEVGKARLYGNYMRTRDKSSIGGILYGEGLVKLFDYLDFLFWACRERECGNSTPEILEMITKGALVAVDGACEFLNELSNHNSAPTSKLLRAIIQRMSAFAVIINTIIEDCVCCSGLECYDSMIGRISFDTEKGWVRWRSSNVCERRTRKETE